jgi:hypothetical protein
MITHLFSVGHNSANAVSGAPSRRNLQQAWDANKRHLHGVQSNRDFMNCYAVRKEVTFRLDVILQMHHRGVFSGCGADPSAAPGGAALCTTLQPAYRSDQHYPFWILPTKEVNDLISALACRFIKPLNYIFSLAPRLANHGGKARAVVYYYTAKLFMRPLLLSLTSQREYSFDKWIWERTWTVRKREGARQVTYRRTGLDLRTTL